MGTTEHIEHRYVPARAWKGIELRGNKAFCTRCGRKAVRVLVHEPVLRNGVPTGTVICMHHTVCQRCDPPESFVSKETLQRLGYIAS